MLSVTGFVSGEPQVKDGDYGRYTEISIRFKTANGKQTHFATGRVFGKKIEVVQKYIHDGDQITVHGMISSCSPRQRKDDKSDYVQFYLDVAHFSLPSKPSTDSMSRPAKYRSPEPAQPEEDEVPF